ncbi:hypothetical protein C9439_02020 [archaeon SCG-AAA382B04]|nr:hypothetical protein C9439_02020 [archaeon SCG-AAA382B04]
MKTLVLCIDRDNDIGSKTGRIGPLIGVEANLKAVEELGLSDPEDSDINAIYEGIKISKELGEEAILATITGSENVGVKSDQEISRQIDQVLDKVDADKAILVTDGAEDENVIPIVESRIDINSIRRVIVRQSQDLETTYYLIKRLMEDPKVLRTFFIPAGLAFIVYAMFNFFNATEFAISGIFAVVGSYMIIRAFGGDQTIYKIIEDIKQSLTTGSMSFIAYVASFILVVAGIIQGYFTWLNPPQMGQATFVLVSQILKSSIWWLVAAGMLIEIVKIFEEYLSKSKSIWKLTVLPFFTVATGLVIWGGSMYAINLSSGYNVQGIKYLISSIFGGILLAFIGIYLTRYARNKVKALY